MCFRSLYLVAGVSWAASWNHPTVSRWKHLRIGQKPGSSNKLSLRIHLGLESLFCVFGIFGNQLTVCLEESESDWNCWDCAEPALGCLGFV
jgi:hypothetical protein